MQRAVLFHRYSIVGEENSEKKTRGLVRDKLKQGVVREKLMPFIMERRSYQTVQPCKI